MRGGGYRSLPKYLRTVFLVLGPEPRLLGQALAASIPLVSRGPAAPGHREGKRGTQGPGSPCVGDGTCTRTVAARRFSLPQPTLRQESGCLPEGSGLLSEERLGNRGQEGGLSGLPGWGWEQSLWSLWLT